MLNKEELKLEAIESCEREWSSLNEFALNEGHPNADVMLAVTMRIRDLESKINELKQLFSN